MSKSLGFWSKILNREEIFEKPVTHTPIMGKPSTEGPREEPTTINLHRAVLDEGQKIIDKVDRNLADMERQKIELLRQREIYVDLLAAAQKHVTSSEAK